MNPESWECLRRWKCAPELEDDPKIDIRIYRPNKQPLIIFYNNDFNKESAFGNLQPCVYLCFDNFFATNILKNSYVLPLFRYAFRAKRVGRGVQRPVNRDVEPLFLNFDPVSRLNTV